MSALSLQTPTSTSSASFGSSSSTLLSRSQTEKIGGGAYAVVKDGPAKVKEEGLLRGLVWNDRWLVLREFQLDFLKSNTSPKISFTIQLRDVTNITRSEVHPYSFEITRSLNPSDGSSPPRDGPTRVTVCKVETDDEVYSWIDSIYQRCPSMGGVSTPTNFTHRVHVGYDPHTGGFVGLPAEWERLLTASAITKEDYQKNPEAVVEVLNFYTETVMKRADDSLSYPSSTPSPAIESANRQIGFSGSSIAPPRPTPPAAYQRQESYQGGRSESYSPSNDQAQRMQVEREARDAQARADAERQRRMDEEIRRKREQQQREQDRQRERDEQAAYNASLPKSRPPMAQQELGGYGDEPQTRSQPDRYNPQRPAPGTPTSQRPSQTQQPQSLRPNLQAQRPAPSAPTNGTKSSQPAATKQPVNGTRQQQPSQKYGNGSSIPRAPANGTAPPSRIPAATAPKPLNVQTKQATGASTQSDAVKKAEQALTRKDDGGGRKEVRMSSMSEAEVMAKLREVVSKERPLDSYNKQKKIGQGASGSVYVARIRENATSPMARRILREQGPKAQVAIKQMDLRNQPRKELIVNEIIVMKESRHENIVNFLDAFLQEESSELWVVMEFMEGGALTDVIDNNQDIREDQIATVCLEVSLIWVVSKAQMLTLLQTCKGLAHLHTQNIIHRDIKSDNVLLDARGNVKISKFLFAL